MINVFNPNNPYNIPPNNGGGIGPGLPGNPTNPYYGDVSQQNYNNFGISQGTTYPNYINYGSNPNRPTIDVGVVGNPYDNSLSSPIINNQPFNPNIGGVQPGPYLGNPSPFNPNPLTNAPNTGYAPLTPPNIEITPIDTSKIAGTNTNKVDVNKSDNNASYKSDLSPYKDVRSSTGGTGASKVTNEVQIDLQDPMFIPSNTRIYKRFDYNNDVIENTKRVQTKGIWGRDDCTGVSGGTGSLNSFYTSSLQTSTSKVYYYDVLSTPDKCTSEFSVTYGHVDGSGSYSGGGQMNDSPSRAIYSQYKLLTDTTSSLFTFSDNSTSKQIYVLNINKSRLGDKLDPGNWELNLGKLNGDSIANKYHTGSNVTLKTTGEIFKFIDDSGDSDQRFSDRFLSSKKYSVVSGSISNGAYSTSSYGWVYPNLGIIVLNGDKLDAQVGFNSFTGSNVNGDNSMKLFKSISGSSAPIGSRTDTYTFDARNSKLITQAHYFVRIPNKEFNYSNNPTYVTGSLGELRFDSFISDPKVYITTVGLYNDYNELVAIAKLSQPVKKSFTEEKLIEIKVEY